MIISMSCQPEPAAEAWDCDPFAIVIVEAYDVDLNEEDDTGDWQVLVLDRFGDRTVNAELWSPR